MKPAFRIIDVLPEDEDAVQQIAALLVDGFKEHWPSGWPDMESAVEEVRESLGEDRISRMAMARDRRVLGWIAGIEEYAGYVWELHPLVVRGDQQGQGIGQALVQDFEDQVKQRGGLTIILGTDDEDNMTSLAGIDLYPDVCGHLAGIRNLRGHPYEFYQKMGFVIVGVIPDANGWGKPDIYMAKRVGWGNRDQ